MRYLPTVLQSMIDVIPADDDFDDLKDRLEWCKEGASFTAPEIMGEKWHYVAAYLTDYFGLDAPTPDTWEWELARVFQGQQDHE